MSDTAKSYRFIDRSILSELAALAVREKILVQEVLSREKALDEVKSRKQFLLEGISDELRRIHREGVTLDA